MNEIIVGITIIFILLILFINLNNKKENFNYIPDISYNITNAKYYRTNDIFIRNPYIAQQGVKGNDLIINDKKTIYKLLLNQIFGSELDKHLNITNKPNVNVRNKDSCINDIDCKNKYKNQDRNKCYFGDCVSNYRHDFLTNTGCKISKDVKNPPNYDKFKQCTGRKPICVGYKIDNRTIYGKCKSIADIGVTIYENDNFTGNLAHLDAGIHDHPLPGIGNDSMSSIKIKPGFKATLYEHQQIDKNRGYQILLNAGNYTKNDLQSRRIRNNDVTSIKVEKV